MKKGREKQFPYIKDFSAEETFYRNQEVSDLTYNQWFWHHPTAFTLIQLGIPSLGIFMLILFSIFIVVKGWYVILLFNAIILFILGKKLYKLVKHKEDIKNVTFYDMWIRDFEVKE